MSNIFCKNKLIFTWQKLVSSFSEKNCIDMNKNLHSVIVKILVPESWNIDVFEDEDIGCHSLLSTWTALLDMVYTKYLPNYNLEMISSKGEVSYCNNEGRK